MSGQVEAYFPVIGILNSVAFNSNHATLAALARDGILRAIITTNFDALTETAFIDAKVELRIYTVKQGYQS